MARHARWGGDPVNVFEAGTFYRVGVTSLPYAARQEPSGAIEVTVAPGREPAIAGADLRHRLAAALPVEPLRALARSDPVIAAAWKVRPGYRPPVTPDIFESLVTSITAQQVNLRWATTTRRRLVEAFGRRRRYPGRLLWEFPAPRDIAGARHADVRSLQFTNAKAAAIIEVAAAVAGGELDGLADAPDEDVIAVLTAIRGVGRWTADWTLARCLGRPHAVAAGDLGVRQAVGTAYLGRRATEEEIRGITIEWGDAANWATHLLLERLSDYSPNSKADGSERMASSMSSPTGPEASSWSRLSTR
jgi:DNA-3-methyladenine glycosylase II